MITSGNNIDKQVEIIELRLPISMTAQSFIERRRIVCNIGVSAGSITTSETNQGDITYSGIVFFQRVYNSGQIYNLLALQSLHNNNPLDLSKPQDYNGITYPATNIRYELEFNQSDWERLISVLEDRDPCTRTLSVFFDNARINKSNYRAIENNRGRCLNIRIHPLLFDIKNEVYWLPEAGNPLEVPLDYNDPEGNFGFCGNNKLYPVSESRVREFSKNYSAVTNYPTDTSDYKIGSASVDRVILALEKLEGVNAWATGENSIADVKYKWDLIVRAHGKHYPLQVKSSLSAASDAYEKYIELQELAKIPFLPIIIWTNFGSSVDAMAKRLTKLFNVSLKEISATANSVTQPKLYRHIDEIGTGKKAHYELRDTLRNAAEKGMWDKEAEDMLQAIVDRGKNQHYQLIKHCRVVAAARTNQAKTLESKERLQQQ